MYVWKTEDNPENTVYSQHESSRGQTHITKLGGKGLTYRATSWREMNLKKMSPHPLKIQTTAKIMCAHFT